MRTAAIAVIFAILGAAAGVGVMAWEPWEDGNGDSTERSLSGTVSLRHFVVRNGQGQDERWLDALIRGDEGGPCFERGTYVGLHTGVPVLVKDVSDNLLATGKLGSGAIVSAEPERPPKPDNYAGTMHWALVPICQFDFEVPRVPAADFYTVEVGRRAVRTFSHDELEVGRRAVQTFSHDPLEAVDWTVGFELED